jgi:hypothetical protein
VRTARKYGSILVRDRRRPVAQYEPQAGVNLDEIQH